MRVQIIGYGSAGRRHAANARALKHDVYVDDTDVERRFRAYQDGMAINPLVKPDAVVIATPAHTHAAIAQELLRVGYAGPLFVEKPLDVAMENQIWATWPHPTTMVGYNLRWQPQARAMIDATYPAEHLRFILMCDMATWPGREYGPFLLECSHEIDLAIACGVPLDLRVLEMRHQYARFKLGPGEITISARAGSYLRDWMVESGGKHGHWMFHTPEDLGQQMHRDTLGHFLERAERGVPTDCPFTQGLQVVAMCHAIMAQSPVGML